MTPLADRLKPVTRRLDRIRGSIRTLFALDGAARLFLALAAFVALTFVLDWMLTLPVAVRLVLLAGGLALFCWIAMRRIAYPLRARITDDDLALFVERRSPELDDRLISAIQLAREPVSKSSGVHNSPELVEALVADAERATATMTFDGVLVRRHVGKLASWAGAVALVIIVSAALAPAYASIYFNRALGGSAKWPQRTHLRVLDFDENHRRVIARGDDLTLAVEFAGKEPKNVDLLFTFASGEKGTARLSPAAYGKLLHFKHTFEHVNGPFSFTVEGGDDRHGPTYEVDTLTPPSLEAIHLFYEYPAYLRKPATPVDRPETAGNISVPLHTKVRFQAASNEDLQAASLSLGAKGREKVTNLEIGATADGRPRLLAGAFEVTEALSEYALSLKAQNGLENRDPIRFVIKGLDDRAPQLRVKDPLGDELITPLCERPLELEVEDDHGVAQIFLEVRVLAQQKDKAQDWTATAFTREQNSRDYGEALIRSAHVLNVGAMGLQPGDHVELRFRAEDYKDIAPRNARTSNVYKLSIVTVGAVEKDLQDAIEKIKQTLKNQKTRQEATSGTVGRLSNKYGKIDLLSQEQQGEVRQAGLEQNDITSRLEAARRDIRHIQRRGVYNKIFNESAAEKLQGAMDELAALTGDPSDASRPGSSRVASAGLDQAARVKTGAGRVAALADAQALQITVATGIQRAIDYLEKWSSYQEVVRITRDLLQKQKDVIKDIKGK